ncbi:MAG: leucine-rich repeat protein, partial [Alphaproteobacteria bacterium]|nr:leucine-rich repeat protein [Alphaproteobacteria bacterium]
EDGNLIISEPTDQNGIEYYIPASLEKVTVNGGYVQDYAFYNCKSLKEIHILSECYDTFENDGSQYIGRESFHNCQSLEKLTVPFVGSSPNNEDGYEQNVFGYWFGFDSALTNNTVEAYSSNKELVCWVDSEDFIAFTGCNRTHITKFEAIYNDAKWTMDIGGSVVSWSGEWMNGITIQGTPNEKDVVTFVYNADFFFVEQVYNTSGNYYQSHIPAKLKHVTVHGGNICLGAFNNCAMIEEIIIGNSITKIGDYAFKGCNSLKSVAKEGYSKTCDSIGQRIFEGCLSLSVVQLPKVINTVGSKIFYGCPSLTDITIPYCGSGSDATSGEETNLVYLFGESGLDESNGVANETLYPLSDVNNISHPYMPKNLTTIKILQGDIKPYGLSRYSVFDTIIIGREVTNIQEHAFEDNKMRNLIVESYSEIQEVANKAFKGCINITKLDFSMCGSLVTIGDETFYGCEYLENVKIPESVEEFGEGCFSYCENLREITIPFCGKGDGDSVEEYSLAYNLGKYYSDLDANKFKKWIEVEGSNYYYAIPASLNKIIILGGDIRKNAFTNFSSQVTIILGAGITSIEEESFKGCAVKHLDATQVSKITTIGASAFYNCNFLEDVKLPANIRYIKESAFAECDRLQNIILPSDSQLQTIEQEAFMGCSSLYTFNIPDNTTTIEGRTFKNCTALTKMFIPKTVTHVGEYIFSGCSSLSVFVEYDYVPNTYDAAWIDNDCGIRVTYACDRSMYGRFNMGTKAKCYKTIPTFDADREIYYYADDEEFYYGNLINAYNNGHIYFIDSDKQAYCKLICNNGIYGFIRYKYVYGVVYHSKFKGSNFELSSMPTASDGIYTSLVCYDNDGDATVILNTDGLICNNASIEYLNSAEINGGKLLASNVILGNNLQINSK